LRIHDRLENLSEFRKMAGEPPVIRASEARR